MPPSSKQQEENNMARRSDPEPLAIIAAIAGVVGASISAVNYWRSHHVGSPVKHTVQN